MRKTTHNKILALTMALTMALSGCFTGCMAPMGEDANAYADSEETLLDGAFTMLGRFNALVTFGTTAFNLGSLFFGGGTDTGFSQSQLDQIRGLLDEEQLEEFRDEIKGEGVELRGAEYAYEHDACLVTEDDCDYDNRGEYHDVTGTMNTNANRVHSAATRLFGSLASADRIEDESRLRLVPQLIHAGSVMLFMQQELALIQLEQRFDSGYRIESSQGSIRDQAGLILDALDDMVEIHDRYTRSQYSTPQTVQGARVGPANRRGATKFRYKACFRDPSGREYCTSERTLSRSQFYSGGDDELIAVANRRADELAPIYAWGHRADFFGDEYDDLDGFRERLEQVHSDGSGVLAEVLDARRNETPPEPAPELTAEDLEGSYERTPVQNDWHIVHVSLEDGELRWNNEAGRSWSLTFEEGVLSTGDDCPYGAEELRVETDEEGKVLGLTFGTELYARQ